MDSANRPKLERSCMLNWASAVAANTPRGTQQPYEVRKRCIMMLGSAYVKGYNVVAAASSSFGINATTDDSLVQRMLRWSGSHTQLSVRALVLLYSCIAAGLALEYTADAHIVARAGRRAHRTGRATSRADGALLRGRGIRAIARTLVSVRRARRPANWPGSGRARCAGPEPALARGRRGAREGRLLPRFAGYAERRARLWRRGVRHARPRRARQVGEVGRDRLGHTRLLARALFLSLFHAELDALRVALDFDADFKTSGGEGLGWKNLQRTHRVLLGLPGVVARIGEVFHERAERRLCGGAERYWVWV
ncbi:unnamed protein product [Cutaneotrichosporon oleaginosum]